MTVRVKICGITSFEDARAAEKAGADAVGFVFADSPRRVSEKRAAAIARRLGPWVARIGVFVNAPASRIARTADRVGLDAVQLHGEEPAATAKALMREGRRVIKAFRVNEAIDRNTVRAYPADAVLFDTAVPGIRGGTGKRFDWSILKGLKEKRPVIVSGGLEPGNVKKLLSICRPYGVDVSSGVERTPGKKDPKKVKEFVRNAKR